MLNKGGMRDSIARIGYAMIGAALCIAFVTRVISVRHYIQFGINQVIEAHIYAGMANGAWPDVGPPTTTTNGYMLPPLYYYFVAPFALLGPDPYWYAIPDAICSFLSIPLTIFVLYRLLDGVQSPYRLFWSALGGLWWSLMFVDIVLSANGYNPSSIPFFALLFAWVAADQLQHSTFGLRAMISWGFLGLLLALLVSLHASALYVMPVAFIVFGGAFIIRASSRWKASLLVILALLTAGACLTPYWQGEAHHGWRNTRLIISSLSDTKAEITPNEKLDNVSLAYAWLDGQAYFPGTDTFIRKVGMLFLIAIVVTNIMVFRGNKIILGCLACIWLFFLYAAMHHTADHLRFKVLILMAPLFLSISSLAFLDWAECEKRVLGAFLAFGVILSMLSNVSLDVKRESEIFGAARLLTISDVIAVFSSLPRGAYFCDSYFAESEDRYLDAYITRRNLHFSFSICTQGMYEVLPAFTGPEDFVYDSDAQGAARMDILDKSVALIPGPPVPPGARVLRRTPTYTLVLIEKGTALPVYRLHLW